MKLKIILSVLLLFSLLKVDANPLVDISIASGKEEVFLHSNDIPFEILTTGKRRWKPFRYTISAICCIR